MLLPGSYINDSDIVKIYKNRRTKEYEVIMNVNINISNTQTNIMFKTGTSEFNDIVNSLPPSFIVVDEELIFNSDNVLSVTRFSDYLFICTSSKKEINGLYKNYNIKVTGKDKSGDIFHKFKGVKMYNKKFNEVKINPHQINNIVEERNRIIINFKTTVSLNGSKDVIPAFEIINFDTISEREDIISKLTHGNFHKVLYNNNYTYINLDNVFLIKKDPTRKRLIFNFSSNIYKEKFGKRILSTVHIYEDFNNLDDMNLAFNRLIK